MSEGVDIISKQFDNLKLKDADINVLLLGHSGVGKSTFINAIANYLDFKKLKEALRNDFRVLIPATFHVMDEQHKHHQVKIGAVDRNETEELGASATQHVKTYVFGIGDGTRRLRLIDTPGLGDTRGIKQDDINCENILSYIGQFQQLHAILFLMDPTNTRITILFEYCVKQILSRLEKSAGANIVFGFTRTRGTNYEPGDTLDSLRKMLNNMKSYSANVDVISLSNNLFCFDNEAFRYLVAVKNGVKMSEQSERNCHESWKVSAKASRRLISYIIGNDKYPGLKPHQIKNTVCINEARRLITQLSQPMAEITQLIFDNIRILERHRFHLNMDNQTLDEMKAKLHIPAINLRVKKLSQPVTVCASAKCAEVIQVEGVNRWHYRKRCHNPCNLKNVPKEMIGDPGLLHCTAMNRTNSCTKCKCDYSTHMHVYYETETFNDKVVDDVVQSNITSKEMALKESKKIINNIDGRRTDYEGERDTIIKITAKFAHFLQHNAITPYNDSYRKYIDYVIDREERLGAKADQRLIHDLQQLLRQYDAQKTIFDKSVEFARAAGDGTQSDVSNVVTSQDILLSVPQLYKLKHFGNKIRELMETQKLSHDNELYQTCEYNHPITNKTTSKKSWKPDHNNKPDRTNKNTGNFQSTSNTSRNNYRAYNDRPPAYHAIANNYRRPNYQNNYPRGRSTERSSSITRNKILIEVEVPSQQQRTNTGPRSTGNYPYWQTNNYSGDPSNNYSGDPSNNYYSPSQYYGGAAASYNNYPPYYQPSGVVPYNRYHYFNTQSGQQGMPAGAAPPRSQFGGGRGTESNQQHYQQRRSGRGGQQFDGGSDLGRSRADGGRGRGKNFVNRNDRSSSRKPRGNDDCEKSKPAQKYNYTKISSNSSSSSDSSD